MTGRRFAELMLRACAALGLGASTLLLIEYLSASPVSCTAAGCDLVRHSSLAFIGPIPLPAFGVAFYATATVLAMLPGRRARNLLVIASALGAVASLGLLAIQAFEIGAFCQYCVVADVSGIALAGLAFALRREPHDSPGWSIAGSVAALAYAAPLLVGFGFRSDVDVRDQGVVVDVLPDPVAREQRPGVATIVEFMDFQCPACRAQHATMHDIMARYGHKVRMVRKHVPLPMHTHAPYAAKVSCCADEQARGDELADLLFEAGDLSRESVDRITSNMGLDMDRMRECVGRMDARLDADLADAEIVGVRYLPTFYVGNMRFEGVQPYEVIRDSVERALATPEPGDG